MCEHCEYAQHIVVGTGVIDCPFGMDVTLFLKRRECVGFPETSEVEFWGFRVCPRPTTRIIYPIVRTNFTATLKPSKF